MMDLIFFCVQRNVSEYAMVNYFVIITLLVSDIVAEHIDLSRVIENMGAVLTHKETEKRCRGMRFYTKMLKELPKSILSEAQIQFISTFYIARLNDHHSIIPSVIEGYLALIDMNKYKIDNSANFLATLFREVSCQSQLRQDRYNIYLVIQKLMEKDVDCK